MKRIPLAAQFPAGRAYTIVCRSDRVIVWRGTVRLVVSSTLKTARQEIAFMRKNQIWPFTKGA